MSIRHEKQSEQKKEQQITFQQEQTPKQQSLSEQLLQKQEESIGNLQIPGAAMLHIEDKESARKDAQTGRNIAHLLLEKNSFAGDSSMMQKVKESVQALEVLLTKTLATVKPEEYIEQLEAAYLLAISNCQYYCDHRNPSFETGIERKKAVADELASLRREQAQLAVVKQLLAEGTFELAQKNGQDLLEAAQNAMQPEKQEQQPAGEPQDPMLALRFEDFAKMLGTHNRGQIAFDGQKLHIINNGKFAMSKGVQSHQNYELAMHFMNIVCRKLEQGQIEVTPAMRMRLLRQLGLTGESEIRPVSRVVVGEIISMVNDMTSSVERVLREGRDAAPAEHRMALAVSELLSGNRENEAETLTKSEHEQRMRNQVLDIIKNAQKQGIQVPELSRHQMDQLVRGNVNLLREQVFLCMKNTYRTMCNLNGGKAVDFNRFAGDKKLLNRMMALTISHMTSVSPEGEMAAEHKLRQCMEEAAFEYSGQKELKESFIKSKTALFGVGGDDGLEQLVEQKLSQSESWQDKTVQVKRGMDGLGDISRSLQRLTEIQQKAFTDGLSEAEATDLCKLGRHIQDLLTGQEKSASPEEMQLVAKELENTRFGAGYENLMQLLKNNFSFAEAAERIANATTIVGREELRQEKSPLAREQEKYQKDQASESERTVLVSEAEALLGNLTGPDRDVAAILLLTKTPSDLIAKNGDEISENILHLRYVLRSFMDGGAHAEDLTVAGVNMRLSQRKNGAMELLVGRQRIVMPYNAALLASRLELDISAHVEKFGNDVTLGVLSDAMEDAEKNITERKGEANRTLFLNVLENTVHLPAAYFNNIPLAMLARLAKSALTGTVNAQAVQEEVERINNMNPDLINEEDTLEMLRIVEQEKKEKLHDGKVVIVNQQSKKKKKDKKDAKEEITWTAEETELKELLADLIFSKETWKSDTEQREPSDRIRLLFYSHAGLLTKIILDPSIVNHMMDKLKLPGAEGLTDVIKEQLNDLLESDAIRQLKEFAGSGFMAQVKLRTALGMALGDNLTPEVIAVLAKQTGAKEEELISMRQGMLDQFAELDQSIEEKVQDQVNEIQDQVTKAVETIFDAKQDEKNSEEFMKPKTLAQIMEEASKGKQGQGKFMKIVLTNYFKDASAIDRRAMMASALRDLMPLQQKPGQEMTQEEKDKLMGNFLGGFLKGAGPLMHKMLQGMPVTSMPEVLKIAVEDMKSNLSPIPKEIVESRLTKIVNASKGTITKIEVVRSLGAASVAQTFLCRMYGPGMQKDGKETVIKLLRPDVRNHMMREKVQMLNYARQTDEQGGMLSTYEGQLLRIEEELDLRIEARNVKLGEVYNKGEQTVQAVKLSNLANPDTNVLVLERAQGITADKYMKKLKKEYKKIIDTEDNSTDNGYDKMIKFHKMHKDLVKRQGYVSTLAKKWVVSGVYDEGFYHGDLHAGNIMVSDEGATVIDFGNATQMTKEQQNHIIHMLCAAAVGNLEGFRHSFHELLSDKSEETYQKKRELLSNIFQDVITTGKREDAGLRIAVALLKAQELGLELPAAVHNFSQCQLRLQNTISEMNEMISNLERSMREEINKTINENFDKKDLMDAVKSNVCSYIENKRAWLKDKSHVNKPEKLESIVEKRLHPQIDPSTFIKKTSDAKALGNIGALSSLKEEANLRVEIMRMKVYRDDSHGQEFRGYVREIVACYTRLCGEDEGALAAQYQELYKKIMDCFNEKEIRTEQLADYFEELVNLQLPKAATEYQSSLAQYKEVKKLSQEKKASADDVAQAEGRLFEKAKELYKYGGESEGPLAMIRRKMIYDSPEKFEAAHKSWFEDENNLGTEMKKAYDDYRAAQTNGMFREMIQHEKTFLALYERALMTRVQQFEQAEDTVRETSVDEFYETMGKVMIERSGATIKKLGIVGMWRYRAINKTSDPSIRKLPKQTTDQTLINDGEQVIDKLREARASLLESIAKRKTDSQHMIDPIPVREALLGISAESKMIKHSKIRDWNARMNQIAERQDVDALELLLDEIQRTMRTIRETIGAVTPEERREKQLKSNQEKITVAFNYIVDDIDMLAFNLAMLEKETNEDMKTRLTATIKKSICKDQYRQDFINQLKNYNHVFPAEMLNDWTQLLTQIREEPVFDMAKAKRLVESVQQMDRLIHTILGDNPESENKAV
ncbi:MAG: AarF/UbiB family protein [bacterium]|nr:AarF/UbiB family protein [bacterium]